MKIYVLMTSLALMTGTAIGYLNGKDTAQSSFVSACTETRIAVVYEYGSDQPRHFHCFELQAPEAAEAPVAADMEGKLVL